jgi:hypothetical protein
MRGDDHNTVVVRRRWVEEGVDIVRRMCSKHDELETSEASRCVSMMGGE